jgi:hypothetical protein
MNEAVAATLFLAVAACAHDHALDRDEVGRRGQRRLGSAAGDGIVLTDLRSILVVGPTGRWSLPPRSRS